jgi:hypothetical protein
VLSNNKNNMYIIYKKDVNIEAINNNDVDPVSVCDTYEEANAIVKEDEVIYDIDDNGDAKYV